MKRQVLVILGIDRELSAEQRGCLESWYPKTRWEWSEHRLWPHSGEYDEIIDRFIPEGRDADDIYVLIWAESAGAEMRAVKFYGYFKKKALVLLEEWEALCDEQEEILDNRFPLGWEVWFLPPGRWRLDEFSEFTNEIIWHYRNVVVVGAMSAPLLVQLHDLIVREETSTCANLFTLYNQGKWILVG